MRSLVLERTGQRHSEAVKEAGPGLQGYLRDLARTLTWEPSDLPRMVAVHFANHVEWHLDQALIFLQDVDAQFSNALRTMLDRGTTEQRASFISAPHVVAFLLNSELQMDPRWRRFILGTLALCLGWSLDSTRISSCRGES